MVVAANQLPAIVERDCVPPDAPVSVKTAVVKYRVVRAHRYVAVAVPYDASWQIGQQVSLDLAACELSVVNEH